MAWEGLIGTIDEDSDDEVRRAEIESPRQSAC